MYDMKLNLLNWRGRTGVILNGQTIITTQWPFTHAEDKEKHANSLLLARGVIAAMETYPRMFFGGQQILEVIPSRKEMKNSVLSPNEVKHKTDEVKLTSAMDLNKADLLRNLLFWKFCMHYVATHDDEYASALEEIL